MKRKGTLATFRIPPEKWEAFKSIASLEDSTASELLINYVDAVVDGTIKPVPRNPLKEKIKNAEATIAALQTTLANLQEKIK